MLRRSMAHLTILTVILAVARPAGAQVEGNGSIGGRVYFDLQKGLSDANEDILTYRFRRVYFGYDMQISDKVNGRFLLDAGQDFGGEYWLFLKHAYAEWRPSDRIAVRAGQQGTIMYGEIEGIWGYRSVAKTFQDHFGIRPSADIGISGIYSISDLLLIKAMMSNGNGFKDRDDRSYGKAYEIQCLITPSSNLLISTHIGLNGFDQDDDPVTDNMENSFTTDVSVGYRGEGFAAGGSYTTQTDHGFNSGSNGSGFSAFGRYSLPNPSLGLLARYDSWDPDTGVDGNTRTYLILGLDYSVGGGLNIIPNLQQTKTAGADPETSFLVTFYWRW